jgi:nicotinamide-nucleotide amidase
VRIELVNTGSELTLGLVLNTHLQWLGRRLSALGRPIERQCAVPDTAAGIRQAVIEAIPRADLIITTGGLGPTSDDLTRSELADLFRAPLRMNTEALANIERIFGIRGRKPPESTLVQALAPEGAMVLQNQNGTAPGLAMRIPPHLLDQAGRKVWLIMLPGPPRELYPMFDAQAVPLIEREFPLENGYSSLTLRTTGMGESLVEERIAPPLADLVKEGLEIGYCARMGEVDVRLSGYGEKATSIMARAEEIVRRLLGRHIYGTGDETQEAALIRLLTVRGETLAVAESCTGGLVGHRLTNVPGASAVLLADLVTYSNEAKQKLLGVRSETLAAHGAVSAETAAEMAEGARRVTGATHGIAATGIAGPGGGFREKPVGTVYIAAAAPTGTETRRMFNPVDREGFKMMSANQVLSLLRTSLPER